MKRIKNENFTKIINDFFKYLKDNQIVLYNEFSFQFELGKYLSNNTDYKVEFERNISKFINIEEFENKYEKNTDEKEEKIKREIDICLINNKCPEDRYAIELKFPSNDQYPEQMYKFVKDIKFMQTLNNECFVKTFCIVIVRSKAFYLGNHEGRYKKDKPYIYRYFRDKNELNKKINLDNRIYKPTGTDEKYITLLKNTIEKCNFNWKEVPYGNVILEDVKDTPKYYIIEIDK